MEFSELIVGFEENQSQYGLGVLNPDGTRIGTKVGQTVRIETDSINTDISYYGFAAIGTLDSAAKWKIFRIDKSSIVLDLKWAEGDEEYDKIWNNRESLTYS